MAPDVQALLNPKSLLQWARIGQAGYNHRWGFATEWLLVIRNLSRDNNSFNIAQRINLLGFNTWDMPG
jgi:hypothetical protein